MKIMLVIILALSIVTIIHNESFGEKKTFFDSVKFIPLAIEHWVAEFSKITRVPNSMQYPEPNNILFLVLNRV